MTIPIQKANDFVQTDKQLQDLKALRDRSIQQFPNNHRMARGLAAQIQELTVKRNNLLAQASAMAA